LTTSDKESDCIFCRIVHGEAESAKVIEDEHTLAFIARPPAVDGHTLVVPKRHSRNIFDIAPRDLAAVILTVKHVAERQRARLGCEGVSLYQANEPAGFQTVFHFHVHVLPRWTGDAIRPAWDAREVEASDLELVAQRLRS
jgi:histidine triad (HIT) family protein